MMRKGAIINGYKIIEDPKPAGGRGMISFAEKGGKTYFIKEFLEPKYPVDGAPGSPKTLNEKRKKCEVFERHHKDLNERISTKCKEGGNLIYAVDFFRSETAYYKINEKVDVSTIAIDQVAKLPFKTKLILLKTITHSLKILHDLKIVHGDLKPDNILIKKTATGNYTTKLIDFDDSYFDKEPPDNETIVGSLEYYSPELQLYVKEKVGKGSMTTKSDIFTLGIIFAEYLNGKRPSFDKKYNSLAQSVADGNKTSVKIKDELEFPGLSELINSMLSFEYEKRPDINEIFNRLSHPKLESKTDKKEDASSKFIGECGSSLRIGKGLKTGSDIPFCKSTEGKEKSEGSSKLRIGKGLKLD